MFDTFSKLHANITMKWPACNQNIHVSQKKSNNHSLCICYLKVIQAQLNLWTLLGTLKVVCINSSFFGYFDSLERSTFSELWKNLYHRFFSLSGNKISRYIILSVPNCKLVKNIFIFCLGQSWYDLCILQQWTSLKLRCPTIFVPCKNYKEYCQVAYNLVHLNKHI